MKTHKLQGTERSERGLGRSEAAGRASARCPSIVSYGTAHPFTGRSHKQSQLILPLSRGHKRAKQVSENSIEWDHVCLCWPEISSSSSSNCGFILFYWLSFTALTICYFLLFPQEIVALINYFWQHYHTGHLSDECPCEVPARHILIKLQQVSYQLLII